MKFDSDKETATDDIDFAANASTAVLEESPAISRLILWGIAAFFLIAVIWATFATLDVVTRATGKIIPSQQVQVIQNLEGGILSAILVKEGDVVERGQVLLRIDDTLAGANYQEGHLHLLALKAKAARLKSEADGTPCNPPPEVLREAPDLVEHEVKLNQARNAELQANLAVVKSQIDQKKHELNQLRAKVHQLQHSQQLADKELNMTKPLVKDGAISEMEVLRIEQKVNEINGELESSRLAIPRIENSLEEARSKADEIVLNFRTEAQTELNKTQSEISRLTQTDVALQDRVQRTQVRSPLHGVVSKINVSTVGGVIQPGMNLLEIVPLDDTLLVEARVRPADIAFIHPEQKANIKLTAYDYAIYGGLSGRIEHISANTTTDDRGESFYLVRVRTDQSYMGSKEHPLPVIPGMTAQVDIVTGKNTLLHYLLKPVLRAKEQALHER